MSPRRTLLIAHRGARSERPENTIAAFERAIELKADGIEFDVHLTSDRVPVVIHDEHLHRVTGNHGKVSETSLSEIQSLKVRKHDNADSMKSYIPTLEEVLNYLSAHDIQLVIEIKAHKRMSKFAADLIGSTIKEFPLRQRPIVSTASFSMLRHLAKCHSDLIRAFIVDYPVFSFLQAGLFAKVWGISGVHARIEGLSPFFVDWCRSSDLHLFAWTAKTEGEVKKALSLGIDGVMVDDLEMAKRVFEKFYEG